MQRNLILFLFLLIALPLSLFAENNNQVGSNVTVPVDKVIKGDYFAVGETVEISGTIEGDLYVLASQAFIDGTVMGDVLITAGTAEIEGKVGGNVRALGGRVLLGGRIENNATVAAGSIDIIRTCKIAHNLVLAGGNIDIGGTVLGNTTLLGSSVRLSGTFYGATKIYVGTLRINSKAELFGGLTFSSNRGSTIDPRATIEGAVKEKPGLFNEIFKGELLKKLRIGSRLLAFLMNFVYSLLVGIVLIRLFTDSTMAAINALDKRPGKAVWYGFVLSVVLVLAAIILLATVLGAPFAIALIALNVIGFYSAKVLFLLWISARISKARPLQPKMRFFVPALLVYFALIAIPFVGIIVSFGATLLGLGAVVLTHAGTRLTKIEIKTKKDQKSQ